MGSSCPMVDYLQGLVVWTVPQTCKKVSWTAKSTEEGCLRSLEAVLQGVGVHCKVQTTSMSVLTVRASPLEWPGFHLSFVSLIWALSVFHLVFNLVSSFFLR